MQVMLVTACVRSAGPATRPRCKPAPARAPQTLAIADRPRHLAGRGPSSPAQQGKGGHREGRGTSPTEVHDMLEKKRRYERDGQTGTELEQDTQGTLRAGEQAWFVVSGSQTSPRKARLGRHPGVQCDSPSPFRSLPSPWSSVRRFLLFTAKEPSRRSQPAGSRGPFPRREGHTHVPRPVPG